MEEQENPFMRITLDDVNEANQLSLHCPICANPVERYADDPGLQPVECISCGALYHKTCWEQAGGACAMIGCEEKTYRLFGQIEAPVLTVNMKDLPRDEVRANKRLKDIERRRQRERSLFARFFNWLLRQIRILNE
ncbi:MAG: hypothetical protein QNJ45_22080 [Ardenticatenaceae bacterium]|nr:hypothetical protein [Ardenticatenaceae bacterium]